MSSSSSELSNSDSPSCSPVSDGTTRNSGSKKSLIMVIAFRKEKKGNEDNEAVELQPYVRRITENGTILVAKDATPTKRSQRAQSGSGSRPRSTKNINQIRKSKNEKSQSSRTPLGRLPSGQMLTLKNCPMAPAADTLDTDTETSDSFQ